MISPNATISELDISKRITLEIENSEADPMKLADCKSSVKYNLKKRSIVRSSGTDDMLAKALVWELQQRGINKAISLFGSLKKEILCVMNQCEQDGLVLIHEQDSSYSRDLARLIKKEFNEISNTKDSVKTFAYFRGLDGKIPDIKDNDKEPARNEKKEISGLLAQMDDAPPEHAEGRNQFDYLRRLTDVIEKLDVDSDSHRIRAIGIIGNDVYDKLIILRALRERFRDKVFFTTDLDARYLHADQNKWSRNLVVASNFDLTMNEGLQSSTMPFRASYQTSTFFATLLAIQDSEKSEASDQVLEEKLNKWLRPQIFEIGNTEAIHLASLSTHCLNGKIKDEKTNNCIEKAQSDFNENLLSTKGNDSFDVLTYESIEPSRTPKISSIKLIVINLFILGLGIFCYCHLRNLNTTCQQANTSKFLCIEKIPFSVWITLGIFILLIQYWMVKDNFPTHYNGEPLSWSEGISVWPNLLIRFFGILLVAILAILIFQKILERIEQREKDKDFSDDFKEIWHEYTHSVGLNKETLPRIILYTVIGLTLSGVVFIFYPLNFPARGYITANLHDILRFSQFFAIWFLIFWVYHEIKNCICFVNKLNKQDKDKDKDKDKCIFSSEFLEKKEKEYRIPKTDLDSYLRFKLIVDVSESINSLIYLPFIMIFVVTIGRSTYFDALGLPLSLIVVFVFEVLLLSWMVYRLRNSANSVRDEILKDYEAKIPKETRSNLINSLIEDIRNTQQGVYASYMNHPLISAILLPIGGISGLHIFEYFFG